MAKTTQPTKEPPKAAKAAEPEIKEAPAPKDHAAKEQEAGEPVPPAGSHKITIEGEGSVPVYVDGAMTRLPRGEPIKVTDAQLAALQDAGIVKGKGK
jgi:hypothetical protein